MKTQNELFLTYDEQGFNAAVLESKEACPMLISQLPELVKYARHDLDKGFCESFQIYDNAGKIIYSIKKGVNDV